MAEYDLSRLEWNHGDARIVLRRGQPTLAAPQIAAQPALAAPASAAASEAAAESEATSNEIYVRSPMVGTFYSAADPETPPFVKVGDTIGLDQVVCLVEAMKVFNEIKSETSGRITRVLVKNAEAVEFDQPLFALAPV
ncbi:MAG: acetyl-CoA carboxylase biotin carboxyl carrier protein [Planctomycetes bacterium]|nr:acetyl-CoA carboxylase biotin carboxyl carrier protein [Planctomycetota bacterium]